jgi:hypothetical protein
MKHILGFINSIVDLTVDCMEMYRRYVYIISISKNVNSLRITLYTELSLS